MMAPQDSGPDPAVVDAVRAVLAGDHDAFALIVRQFQSAILTLATVILRDRQAAMEVTEEVYVRAWRGLKSFDQTRPIKPWLMGIAVNGMHFTGMTAMLRLRARQSGPGGWRSGAKNRRSIPVH